MESIKIRELEEKSLVNPDDTIILEDNSGTLQVPVSALQSVMQGSLFCKSVEDMRSSVFNAGDVVETLGYHTAGDGGMATYVIVNAPDEIDNDITVISLHTSDTLKAQLIYDKYISPLQAGAYGDGVHDDTESIKKLLSLKLPIKFPKKEFRAKISLTDGNIIDFNGSYIKHDDTVITISDISSDTDVTISDVKLESTNGSAIAAFDDECNIIISNCTIIRNNYLPSIDIDNADCATIDSCIFIDKYDDIGNPMIDISIDTEKNSSSFINNCAFSGSRSMYINCDGRTVITNCKFESDEFTNFHVSIYGIGYISNCYFDGRPAIYAGEDSIVSISDLDIEKAKSVIKTSNGSVLNIDKFIIYGANSEDMSILEESIIDASSEKSTVELEGQIICDKEYDTRKISFARPYYGKVFTYSNNFNSISNEILDADENGNVDITKAFDLTVDKGYRRYIYVNADIRISARYQVKKIINGIEGQVLRLYAADTNAKIICGDSGSDYIYNQDASEIILSVDTPCVVRYHNGFWAKIK